MTFIQRVRRKLKHLFILKPHSFFVYIYYKVVDFSIYYIAKNRTRVFFTNSWANRKQFKTDWYYSFIRKHIGNFIISAYKPHIEMFQVFGSRNKITQSSAPIKLFATGENTFSQTMSEFLSYSDYCVNEVDLSIGFSPPNAPNAVELPLWILYFFSPTDSKDTIRQKWVEFNMHFKQNDARNRFCALIARHDKNGIRTHIFNAVNSIDTISCAGTLFHNDNELVRKYNDDKQEYLRQFKFNICPENSCTPHYVTEKIFQSLYAGCVPIYWGGIGDTYNSIINKNCYFMWKEAQDNTLLIKEITKLNNNNIYYTEFKKCDPIFIDPATEYVYEKLQTLDNAFEHILKSKNIQIHSTVKKGT